MCLPPRLAQGGRTPCPCSSAVNNPDIDLIVVLCRSFLCCPFQLRPLPIERLGVLCEAILQRLRLALQPQYLLDVSLVVSRAALAWLLCATRARLVLVALCLGLGLLLRRTACLARELLAPPQLALVSVPVPGLILQQSALLLQLLKSCLVPRGVPLGPGGSGYQLLDAV